MLKVEYPCREYLSSYQNPIKPVITWAEAKKHLHDVRIRRQKQLASNINECQKLRTIHKQIFNRQFDSNSMQKSFEDKSTKSINTEYSSYINKYSIPRIEHASVIYRQAIPTFEVETLNKLENETPIVKELTQYLTETSCAISNDKIENNQSLSSIRKDKQRHLSVSSVSSCDKQANRVYEKWPDYNQISDMLGYRIEPPSSKIITADFPPSRPSGAIGQRKRNVSTKFSTASKQIKDIISLNSSLPHQNSSKTKISSKTNVTSIINDKQFSTTEKFLINNSFKEIKPKLPNILCPSSITYSNRIQTRQWLIKNNFSSHGTRTLPLL